MLGLTFSCQTMVQKTRQGGRTRLAVAAYTKAGMPQDWSIARPVLSAGNANAIVFNVRARRPNGAEHGREKILSYRLPKVV